MLYKILTNNKKTALSIFAGQREPFKHKHQWEEYTYSIPTLQALCKSALLIA